MKIRFSIENESKHDKQKIMCWLGDLRIEDIDDPEVNDFYIYVNSLDELYNIVADIGEEIVVDIIMDQYFIKLR